MKKYWFVLLLFLPKTEIFGQAPVTDESWLPDIGDTFYIFRITYSQRTDPFIDLGEGGENMAWDFNHKYFNLDEPTHSVIFISPEKIGKAPYDKNSNLASGDSSDFVFYIRNGEGLFLTEDKSTNLPDMNPINHHFEKKPNRLFKTNLHYGDVIYDTSESAGFMSYNYSDTSYRNITTSITHYDAYGNLFVAGLTFNNVIRTRKEFHNVFIDDGDTSYSYIISYAWHSAASKYNLLNYVNVFNLVPKGNSVDTVFSYAGLTLKLTPSSIPKRDTPVLPKIKTRAFVEKGEIIITAQNLENTNYQLYDVSGRLLELGPLQLPSFVRKGKIDIKYYPQGIYLLVLQRPNHNPEKFKLFKR